MAGSQNRAVSRSCLPPLPRNTSLCVSTLLAGEREFLTIHSPFPNRPC